MLGQSAARHEAKRAKFLLVSIMIIIIGVTFAFLPVQATQIVASTENRPIATTQTFALGYAYPGYVINVNLAVAGTIKLMITNIDPTHTDYTLLNTIIYQSGQLPSIPNSYQGTIQFQIITYQGASATLNASIQNTATTYPLLIPGLVLLVAGAALILTRVVRIRVSVSAAAPINI